MQILHFYLQLVLPVIKLSFQGTEWAPIAQYWCSQGGGREILLRLRIRFGHRAAPAPLAEGQIGWSTVCATGKATLSLQDTSSVVSCLHKRRKGNPAAGHCQEVKDTDSRAVGKGVSGRPFHSEHKPKEPLRKRKAEVSYEVNPTFCNERLSLWSSVYSACNSPL